LLSHWPPLGVNTEESVELLLASLNLPVTSEQNQESDQESHDTEDLSETFAWSEAMTVRRSIQGFRATAAFGSITKHDRPLDQTRSALQRSRAHSILAESSSRMTSRLCRFTC